MVIIVNSRFLLKRFLECNNTHKGFYVCFSRGSSSLTELLKKHGIEAIRPAPLSRRRREAILHDYVEVIGRLGEINGHLSHWWMTDIASKNAYCTPLLPLLDELVHVLDAFQTVKRTTGSLFVVHPSWPVASTLGRLACRNGWKVKILASPWARTTAKWSGKAMAWAGIFKCAAVAIREIRETIKHFGRSSVPDGSGKSTYVIKSFIYPDSFTEDGKFQDPFFGKLPEYLSRMLEKKIGITTIALGLDRKQECYEKMGRFRKNDVIPLESMLCYGDVFRGLWHLCWMLIIKPFKVRRNVCFLGCDITELLRELFACGGWRIPFGQYLYGAIGKRLADKCRVAVYALTYEGNPWERAFIAGIRKTDPTTRIIGYQHSVVPQTAANMFQSQKELDRIPLPDIVLTTGPVPADILTKYGAFPKKRIRTSCALRYQYPEEIHPKRSLPDQGGIRILVALCGVIGTLPLLKYAVNQARSHRCVEFLIRAHPVLPFEKLYLLIDKTTLLPENIKISKGHTVYEDLNRCDVVLYWGSSVALDGVRWGKPVIHFSHDELLSHDPLFDLNDFKWSVDSEKDLMETINRIRMIPNKKFEALRDRAQNYVAAYHSPVSEELMALFLPVCK